MNKYKSIDLFAGIGGIRLGFENAFGDDLKTVFVSEWDKKAQETYRTNFHDDFAIAGDITKINEADIPDFDICLAGFPCQAFSIAGKKQGFNDDYKGTCRGTLFLDVARICDYHKPKVIFCENVKGLYIHDKGRTFKIICDTFEDLGYKVFHKVLNSKDFGVPQNRERVYIVAFRNDIAPQTFEFPVGTDDTKRIYNILETAPVPAKYYLSDVYLETLKNHKARHAAKGNGFGYEIRSLGDVAGTIVCGGMGRERNLIIDNRQKELIPTTHIKGNINSEYIRKMTPREWARLQGFPDSFILPLADTHMYKQFGNSVTVNVIEAIANRIMMVLDNKSALAANNIKENNTMPNNTPVLSGNKGEWSEIYIFLKLLDEGKVYAADKDMNLIPTVYLNILKILREEIPGYLYEYKTGDIIKIDLNGESCGPDISHAELKAIKEHLWHLFETTPRGNISSVETEVFLNRIHIFKLKAPPFGNSTFFGGTEDIVLQVSDYRTSIISNVGFSCKSEFAHKATLFNASKDNTNFKYELLNMNDEKMNHVNNLFNQRIKNGTIKYDISVKDRIKYLKENGVEIVFEGQLKENAERNIVLSCGTEMPIILADILKYYYWEHNAEAAHSSFSEAINYLALTNPANYSFSELESIYRSKVGKVLYDMFTGMRLSKPWNGRSMVSGGYIVAKADGEVLAYHTTLADEFKDFLVERLGLETPSSSRHNAMQVYKENGKYYINFNLQVRFKG